MDAGPLFCISSAGTPSSPGVFPHFNILTACTTSSSSGGGSCSGLCIDSSLSFSDFPKRFAPYSCHRFSTFSGSVTVLLSFMQA